jgi:ribosome-interacting GTPase 1
LDRRRLLEIELDAVGIRLNKQKPDIVFKRRTTGGVSSSTFETHKQTQLARYVDYG